MKESGIDPETTADLVEAYELVLRDGAVCFADVGINGRDAVELARSIFAGRVRAIPEAAPVP